MKYFGHMKIRRREIMEGYLPGRRKRGWLKRRWVQDIIDELQISALDAGHLDYDLRRVFKEESSNRDMLLNVNLL
jgi:hypothetical protein